MQQKISERAGKEKNVKTTADESEAEAVRGVRKGIEADGRGGNGIASSDPTPSAILQSSTFYVHL